jgi:hypothetical protein
MNTNALKKFAQEARIKLLDQVGAKLEYVLNTDTPELREKGDQVRKLREELTKTTKEQMIDKVSYTWFNRFMALRFMDANDYQPIGLRVLTPKNGYTLPELLDEAKSGNIPDEIKVRNQRIYDLLDGKIPSLNAQNEAYKELLIGACNNLNRVFPFLFERINDFTELLLPDDLTSELSIIQDIRDGMTIEDCAEVEIIGWLYQFYISAKKDEVFASKAAVKKEDIPAATQLFTPRWIVEYMVQNTVGKLWLQNRPDSNLREHMPYFVESPSVVEQEYLKINSVEEIKLLDQACGSGHILVYGFELFFKIYEEEGYSPNEIPELIIKNNLFGFEIDDRAAQLAAMAVMMKARNFNKRIFKKNIEPNILCYKDLALTRTEINDTIENIGAILSEDLCQDLINMRQATNYGSLIAPFTSVTKLQSFLTIITNAHTSDVFLKHNLEQLSGTIQQLILLSQKYHCIVDNPPYMGGGKMNEDLGNYVKIKYPTGKADLSSCFMLSSLNSIRENGFIGMVTLDSWMFLGSFEELRKKIISESYISSLMHVGWNCFPQGHVYNRGVAFVIKNSNPTGQYGTFVNLSNVPATIDKKDLFKRRILNREATYSVQMKNFDSIPGTSIGYWLKDKTLKILEESRALSTYGKAVKGLDTCDNDRFVRYWYEVNKSNFSTEKNDTKKWFVYQKGGEFRKWYGNVEKVVNWKDDGFELKNFKNPDNSQKSRPQNTSYYFEKGITWSSVGSSDISYRLLENSIFGGGGNGFFSDEKSINFILVFLNSKITKYFLELFNPTINNLTSDLHNLPVEGINRTFVEEIGIELLELSKKGWNAKDYSWDFKKNELIRINGQDIEESYDLYQQYWKNKFFQVHKNEEKLNEGLIEIYGLTDELSPNVNLEEITLLKEETSIVDSQLIFHADEVLAQFITYVVGCMFGRYSLDKQGLILANQGETLETYLQKVEKAKSDLTFVPDEDNIIPVLDDEWFEDDITGRFYAFLKASFGVANFDKNLAFVEECLGKDVRKYFTKDFYADHIKRYKKRPIYWMFSSAKGSFNVLIYMHRYTPDTLNNILNDYLIEYREKLNNRIEHLDHLIVSGTSLEQTKAQKEKDRLKLILIELLEYEREVLRPLAIERIKIDLDEGVLVNYNKFGKAIKEVAGLNDKATKKKVREFDWINVEEIR